jgi:hypothetical protein
VSILTATASDLASPNVVGLLGCRLWTAGSELIPPPGEPCWCCRAVRDKRGKVVSGGVLPGDQLGCAACRCLEPNLERTAHRRGKPSREEPRRGRPRAELTPRARLKLSRSAEGRVLLAMRDAEAAGDAERAGRLQTLLYRHRDREIGDAELDRLAGTTPAADEAA